MVYTVKELARIAHVTVKTLHHYHKVGLLVPFMINSAGYRFYGQNELERLQEILFFRELDFSLKQIKEVLAGDVDRISILSRQRLMIMDRRQRLENLIHTLDDSVLHTLQHETLDNGAMFKGFNEAEWKEILEEQSDYVKEKYRFDIIGNRPINADVLNQQAQEATQFLQALAKALRDGWSYQEQRVQSILSAHLAFLNGHGFAIDPAGFLEQARFQVKDDFHRKMMESIQVGLAYFYLAAVEAYTKA